MFDNLLLTFNFNPKVSCDVFKTKMDANQHLHFKIKYRVNWKSPSSTCHFNL